MQSSQSDSESGWNKELITAVSKKQGKGRNISEQERCRQIQDSLEQGADINTVDEGGNTALHVAVKRNFPIIVQFLLNKGARTDIPNGNGNTVIALAANLGKLGILSILNEPSTSQASDLLTDDSLTTCKHDNQVEKFETVTQMSGRKRTPDYKDGTLSKRYCRTPSADVPQPEVYRNGTDQSSPGETSSKEELRLHKNDERMKSKPRFKDAETYNAGGLKNSLHGIVYQLKHLMLILHRVWKMGYPFRLATEMDAAEKFDDVILHYQDDGDEVYRFFQVKHKQDGTKAIGARHLLDGKDGEFGLVKYFVSWRKIQKHPDFGRSRSKNFVLCTNIGLDVEDLKKADIDVRELEETDDFLNLTHRTKQTLRYKILYKRSGVYDKLKLACDAHRLAQDLAERVCGSQDIHLNTDLLKCYHVALAEEVIDVRMKKLSDNFIKNNGLSEKAAEFRRIFFFNAKRLQSERNTSDEVIWKRLGKRSLKLSLTFGTKIQPATKPELIQFTQLPVDQINDAEIAHFLDEFILAVNQPSEAELGEIIKCELRGHSQFDLLDASFIKDSFQNVILEWFKAKQGKFLKNKDAEDFFEEMEDKLGSLVTMTLSFEYLEKLKEFDIQFDYELRELQNFVNSSNYPSYQILEITSSEQTLLTALRVYQTVTKSENCEEKQSFIFIRLETLLQWKIMERVLRAFQCPRDHNLLIVDCESISAKQHLQTLWNPICEIMAEKVYKRMIVITQQGKELGTLTEIQSKLGHQTYHMRNDYISFRNLTGDSQKKLLQKPVDKFQGQTIETSFGELLGIRNSDNLGADELEDLFDIIDSHTLVELICKEKIQIGGALEQMGKIRDYYINRTICRHVVIKKDILKDRQMPDLLAISDMDEEQLGSSSMDRDLTNITILDSTQEEEQFKILCARNVKRNVHLLKYESDGFIWRQSHGDITYLIRYKDARDSDDNNGRTGVKYLNEGDLAAYHKPVIISDTAGMGKSTMLSYLAWKMKQNEPDMLVLKIDLNHHATALAEVMKKSSYNLRIIQEAVQFLVKELLSCETDLQRKVFKRIIEKHRKVALIFDGFDEISPTYDSTVIDLLKSLANYGIKKLFVATRPHTREVLESSLNEFSYEICPLSTDNQEDFLTEFWKIELGLRSDSERQTEERIKMYAKVIIKKMADLIKDQKNRFTGIPLQARLVGEIFGNHSKRERKTFDSCKEFIDSEIDQPKLPKKINLIYLYEHFVEKKFEIFYLKRGGDLADVAVIEDRKLRYDMFIRTHERLALYALMDKDKVEVLLPSEGNERHITRERTGIITQFIDGQPHFGHKTYAEYFAAKFLLKLLKTGPLHFSIRAIFVTDILLREKYETLRAFLNCLMSGEHNNALEPESWRYSLNQNRSWLKKTIFHVATAERNNHIHRLFFNCLDKNPEDREALIEVKDSSGRTAIHWAAKFGHLYAMKSLVKHMHFDVNFQDLADVLPLHAAAQQGKLDAVKSSLDNGANVNSQDNDGWTPIHVAAQQGVLDVVKLLLDNGANVNSRTNDGWTPFHSAAGRGKLNVLNYLLDNGGNINSQANDGWMPIHIAALQGELNVVKFLLDNGADVNSQTKNGWTPFQSAVTAGKLIVMEYLLDNGANVDSRTNDGCMPIHVAAHQGEFDVVKYLLNNGASVNSQTNDGWMPIHIAAHRGKLDVVKFLLDNGAHVDSQTNNGWTPFQSAAAKGKLIVMKCLLDNGANVNSRANDGWMPIHVAAQQGELDVVKYLLNNGADVNSQMNGNWTPFHVAAQEGRLDVLKYLVDKGANVNSQANDGWVALHVAAQESELDVVKYLLDNGAHVNSQTYLGWTPLYSAAWKGKFDVGKYLLDNGADVNSQMNGGWTPIHAAAQDGRSDVLKYLVNNGAKVNSPTIDGRMPIHVAAQRGALDVVKFLIDHGANINYQMRDRWTPLHSAVWCGQLDVVKYLLNNGADFNSQTNAGWTFHAANIHGSLNVLKYLVDYGADVHSETSDGRTPIHIAARLGGMDVLKYLVEKGANINSKTDGGCMPIHFAAQEGRLDVIEYLIGKGANVNSRQNDGCTPLHAAAQEGKLDVVKYLVNNKANVDSKMNDGLTPLNAAVRSGALDVVKYLLELKHKGNPYQVDCSKKADCVG